MNKYDTEFIMNEILNGQNIKKDCDELKIKIPMILNFMATDEFLKLDVDDQVSLRVQLAHMVSYCNVLRERLERKCSKENII